MLAVPFGRLNMPFSGMHACLQVLPQVEQPQSGMSEGVRTGLLGIGALVAMAGAYYIARKLLSAQLPKVQKVRLLSAHPADVPYHCAIRV